VVCVCVWRVDVCVFLLTLLKIVLSIYLCVYVCVFLPGWHHNGVCALCGGGAIVKGNGGSQMGIFSRYRATLILAHAVENCGVYIYVCVWCTDAS